MNAVATPLDPFQNGSQQNPFIFCDQEDYGSDESSNLNEYSFKNASKDGHNNALVLSFHSCEEARPARRKCATGFRSSLSYEEETTTAMPPDNALTSKRISSTVKNVDGVHSETSTTATSSNDGCDDSGGENYKKKSTCLKTHEDDSSSAQETDRNSFVQIGTISFETTFDNKDYVPLGSGKENNEKLREDAVSDITPASTATKKRGSRRHRSQKSMKKKWKHLDAEEMGFQLSSFPRLPAASKELKSDPTEGCGGPSVDDSTAASTLESVVENSTEDSTKADSSSQPINSSPESCEKGEGDHETVEEEESDDVAFFASIGVDLHDSGEVVHRDDIWQWDGVCLDNTSVLCSGSSEDSSGTKRKSDRSISMKPCPSGGNGKKSARAIHVLNNKYVCNMNKREVGILFDSGCVSSTKTYLRPDRHRRSMKSHKAVKSKHAKVSDIFHNPSKKHLYMHHRLVKLLNINTDFIRTSAPRRGQPTAMPKIKVDHDWLKGIRVRNRQVGQSRASPHTRPAPEPQNLNHVLAETNVPGDFEMDLVSFLFSVQNRELTPEDYEMLLRLDDTVKAKTVSKNVLDSLKTEIVGEGDNIIDSMCTICMEPYAAGQVRKFLPCQHDFHNECIDAWLNNSSQNCPLDGLPVDGS